MRRATISEWHRREPFWHWLYAAVEKQTDQLWPLVLANCGRLALRGSIDHIKEFARYKGPKPLYELEGAHASAALDGLGPGGVVINLPRPPSSLAGHRVVIAMLEQAEAPATSTNVIDVKP